jgi:hypothetical protein
MEHGARSSSHIRGEMMIVGCRGGRASASSIA